MIKLLESVNVDPILKSYYVLETSIQWTEYGVKSKQAGLQYKEGDDPWDSAVGKSRGVELTYNNLNPLFKDTVFETLIARHNLKRTRLLWVYPWACYSMHRDTTPRIHIPLITNTECYFVFKDDGVSHMPAGGAYWVDTRKRHTFMNCSEQLRLHLVGVVES